MSPRQLSSIACAAAVLSGAGCGGHSPPPQPPPVTAHLEFVRSASEPRPVWVAAYFLDSETILDGESVSDLIANKDEYRRKPGVVDAFAFPLAPDATESIHLEPLDPAARWVLLAAESDEQDPCAWQKIEIGKDRKMTLLVEAQGHCLNVKRRK